MSVIDWELLLWLRGSEANGQNFFCLSNGSPRFPFLNTYDAVRAARFLLRYGFVSADSIGRCRLTELGLKATSVMNPPVWSPPPRPPILDIDLTILTTLAGINDLAGDIPPWIRPRDVGGTDSSVHSTRLRLVLARHGYVEVQPEGTNDVLCGNDVCYRPTLYRRVTKTKFLYRITRAGLAFLPSRSGQNVRKSA
jgi:hypothetical protein